MKVDKMILSLLFVLLIICNQCHGFLLDDRTPVPTNTASSALEEQLNLILKVLGDEKQSRIKLEKKFSQLQNELLATQQGATQNYHIELNFNHTLGNHASSLILLETKYNNLQNKYDLLQLKFDDLKQNHSTLRDYTQQIESALTGFADRQSIMNIHNETKLLEKALQANENKLNSVITDVIARKQDFLALLQKADTTEQTLTNATRDLQNELYSLASRQNATNERFKESVLNLKTDQENNTSMNVGRQINPVAVTVCASGKTYSSSSIILFPTIHMSNSITHNDVAEIGTTGKFSCKSQGIYLISAYIKNGANGGGYPRLYKNSVAVADIHFTTSADTYSITILEKLSLSDTIYIKTSGSVTVGGGLDSCISILQIT